MESLADKIIEQIARERLGVQTLEEQGSDRLDFHSILVSNLKDALMDAFDAGFKMCAEARG